MNEYTTTVFEPDNTLIVTFEGVSSGWEQWFLVTSDRHWDSVHTDRAMQRRHLDQALERNALVIDIGDLFDAMQGRDDRRSSKSAIRPEHVRSDYFDALVDTATTFFEPYASNILMLGTGNHETSVLRHHEINLTWALARRLNHRTSSSIHLGRYAGYIKLQFSAPAIRKYYPSLMAYYHHGSGGNSPVTRGVIQTNRRAAALVDPDVIFSGHTHQTWLVPIPRERVTTQGRVYTSNQWHVQVPSYKQASRTEGWEVERGMSPTMKGAVWWRLVFRDNAVHSDLTWAT